ncbi:MAG: benzoate-CoA ligase family protein [Parasphingorhabdus sp.]|jgi:benzoate-CoA ligase family protein
MENHTADIGSDVSQSIKFSDIFNVAALFIDRHPAEGRADKTAVICHDGSTATYAELVTQTNRAGNGLIELGLVPGDRVLMIVKDCLEFYYLFWGSIKVGIIPVPVNTLLRSKDYTYMADDSGCRLLVYSKEFTEEVLPALSAIDKIRPQSMVVDDLDLLLQKSSEELEITQSSAIDDCFWLYSSGSTGNPKGAVHLHRDMVVTSQRYGVDTIGLTEDDVCFSAAKLFFAYGLGNAMTFPLWCGATAVLFDQRPTPDTTFEVIKTHRPTVYFGVPTLYAAQLKSLETDKQDLSSLRMCISAGEALPGDIFNRWKAMTGLSILDGIGSTEALHIFISNRESAIRIGTSGLMVPGYRAKIVDEQGEEVATGESGQLLITGDSGARLYWNKPEKTAETMQGEWLSTGDTYIKDEDEFYHYCGRNDDMMKVGGIWCSPFEIEAALMDHADVFEVAVVGYKDDSELTKPEAHVVLQDNILANQETSDRLLLHCKSVLAPYKFPRWFHYVGELPKTATGKIQRFKLRH